MARARANGKPVVAMKVGGSAVDAAAAASHTASLAGSDAIYDAAFRQLGVERAVTPEDLIEIAYACTRGRLPSCVHNATGFLRIAYACTRGRLPRSRRLAVMMVSDGPGVLMADAAEREGVQLTPLPPEAQAEVLDWVPFAPPRNPLDLTAQPLNEPALIDKSFDLLLGQEGFPAIAAFSLLWASSPKTGEILFNSISAAAARYPDRYFALSVIARDEVRQRYEEAGIAIFEDPWRAVEAVLLSPILRDGVETIVGVQNDPVFGPVVMFGLGGIFVEVMRDVTFRIAPFGVEEARRMIDEIKGAAVLEGARGRPAADIDALAEGLSRLSRFAAAQRGQLTSIDINPLLVRPRGAGVVALDALILTPI